MDDALEAVRALYDELPKVDCKGWCWHSCGPIDMSDAERERIEARGVEIQPFTQERSRAWANNERLYCSALSFKADDGTMIGCSVYEDRPLICRIWGVGEDDLSCPYGCETTGTITHAEVSQLLTRSFRLGGHGDDNLDEADEQIFADLMSDPEMAPLVRRFLRGDQSVVPALQRAVTARRRR